MTSAQLLEEVRESQRIPKNARHRIHPNPIGFSSNPL